MNFLKHISILINFSAVVQALILIVQLQKGKYLNKITNRFLALVLLAFVIIILNSIRVLFDPFLFDTYELYSNAFLLVITSSLYLYIYYLTRGAETYQNSQLWNYAPFVVYILAMVFLNLMGKGKNDPWIEMLGNIGFVIFIIQNTVYITASFFLLRAHQLEVKKNYPYTINVSLNWIRNILFSYTITFIIAISFFIYQVSVGPIPDLINLNIVLIYSLHIIILAHKSISKPEVLFKLIPYQNDTLSQVANKEIFKKVESLVKEEKLYLNTKLTLKDISDRLKISSRSISQSINQNANGNFFDFINGYRVDEIKRKIANPNYSHLTLLALAEECGFQSGSVFNSAFKKNTGMNPSEYRKKLRSEF